MYHNTVAIMTVSHDTIYTVHVFITAIQCLFWWYCHPYLFHPFKHISHIKQWKHIVQPSECTRASLDTHSCHCLICWDKPQYVERGHQLLYDSNTIAISKKLLHSTCLRSNGFCLYCLILFLMSYHLDFLLNLISLLH